MKKILICLLSFVVFVCGLCQVKKRILTSVDMQLSYKEKEDGWYNFEYETSQIRSIRFYLLYNDDGIENEVYLCDYDLNNTYNYKNMWSSEDSGIISIKVDNVENGFYISCLSNSSQSKPFSFPSQDVAKEWLFDYQITPLNHKIDDDTYQIIKCVNSSKEILLCATFESSK